MITSQVPPSSALARWAAHGATPRRRLVFFPHAGGGGLTGRDLAAPDTEVLVHRRPGREARMGESPVATVDQSVAEALTVLLPVLDGDDLPTDVMGHSYGAVLAAEFVAALERDRPGRIRRVVISAKAVPPDPDPTLRRALSSDDALAVWLADLGGTPAELLADPVMREMILTLLRTDLTASLNYPGPPPALSTPMLIVAADRDVTAPPSAVAGWARTTTGPVEELRVQGGHHAVLDEPEPLHGALTGFGAGSGHPA